MVSTTTIYALRAMVQMARLKDGESILGRDLAKTASVPANYLSKVLLVLKNAELVEATRGLGGGYRLAKHANEIPLFDVAKLFEGAQVVPGCILGETHECCDELACSAHNRWKKVVESYVEFLHESTVADIGHVSNSDEHWMI